MTDSAGRNHIQLSKNWAIKKLMEADPMRPRWTLMFKGMQWLVISEFLPPGRGGIPTIDEELRAFADEIVGRAQPSDPQP